MRQDGDATDGFVYCVCAACGDGYFFGETQPVELTLDSIEAWIEQEAAERAERRRMVEGSLSAYRVLRERAEAGNGRALYLLAKAAENGVLL
jgi:hypothetical protein